MEPVDVEALVSELELRVDRLRSLYEQYFMGIEKLEPGVPRKDVDRRIAIIRKEQIRNTGLRFRFLMLVQRYNTYQTHWQRICREIENGTYKRHMMRAQARFGDPKAPPAPRRRSSLPPAPAKDDLGIDSLPPPMSTDASILDDEDFAAFAALEPLPTLPSQVAAKKTKTYSVDMDFGELGDPLDREPSSMRIPIATPPARPSPLPPSGPSPHADSGNAGRAWRKAAPAAPRISAMPPAPSPPQAPPARPAPPAPAARPPPVPPRAPPPMAPRPAVSAPPPPVAKPAAPPAPIARPAAPPAPIARPAAPPAPIARPAAPPATIAKPAATPVAARPAAPPPIVAKPAAPAPVVARPAAPPPVVAKPAAPAPVAARPAPAAPPPKPATPAPRAANDLPDERVRQLYSQYVETKRRQNESTAAITYDNLAKSLRESSAKLREKHGKSVDFEVAVKDGKTILKPVVK